MLMNHPPPITENNYRNIGYEYHDAVKLVADEIMEEAVNELRDKGENGPVDAAVTFD